MKNNKNRTPPQLPSGTGPAFKQLNRSVPAIVIYIEDKGDRTQEIWNSLIRKLLHNEHNTEIENRFSIIGLGGKSQVIEHCKENQNENELLLYVVDADLDLLTEKNKNLIFLNNLYTLKSFCIENYLLIPSNIIKLSENFCKLSRYKINSNDSSSNNSTITESDHVSIFDFESWKKKNESLFEILYIAFATIQLLDAGIKNVNCNINHLCEPSPNNDSLSKKKIEKKIKNKLLKKYDKEKINIASKKVSENIKNLNFMRYADGKKHLLELIRMRLKNKFPDSNNKKKLIFKILTMNISPDCDPELCNKIKNLLK